MVLENDSSTIHGIFNPPDFLDNAIELTSFDKRIKRYTNWIIRILCMLGADESHILTTIVLKNLLQPVWQSPNENMNNRSR